jgi:hypothetical protein
MTKKDVLFLLLPSALVCLVAGTILFDADAFVLTDRDRQQTQQRIDEQVRKVESGETPLTRENLVKAMGSSYLRAQDVQENLAQFYSKMGRRSAYLLLFGVAAQFYVVFRVKAGLRKRDASVLEARAGSPLFVPCWASMAGPA